MIAEHDSFAEAYVAGLQALLSEGNRVPGVRDETSVGSSFGHEERPTLELTPHQFTISHPSACLLDGGARQPSDAYIAGQWLWTMAGSDELDSISYYNSRGRVFSDDGARLGGAFGARMRRHCGDQLERVLALLRRDPNSRRAMLIFAEPGDGRVPTRDFPCALATQYLIRDGALEAITTMRSQSALMVLPYDVSLMAMTQLWAAAELGIAAGAHHWVANSFHLYADEVKLAEAVLADRPDAAALPPVGDGPHERLEALQDYETRLRATVSSGGSSGQAEVPSSLRDESEMHGFLARKLRAHADQREREAGGARATTRA